MNHTRFGLPRVTRVLALAGLAGGAMLTTSSPADAQVAGTTNKPLPNVMLLVDTSGSMERMLDNSLPSSKPSSTCNPGTASEPNRWGLLLQALTGSFQPYYSCDAMPRTAGSRFSGEYKIAGKQPYDVGYDLPYHRPITGAGVDACATVPYKLAGGAGAGGGNYGAGGNAIDFPPDAVQSFTQSSLVALNGGALPSPPTTNACTFDQANDGQLDAVIGFVRFGLMTFDTDTYKDQGVSAVYPNGGSVNTAGPTDPFKGTWSYWRSPSNTTFTPSYIAPGWAKGNPPACAAAEFEVGARNWAAPVWEGRMIPFANPVGTLLDVETTNQRVQTVLLNTRPYGATPLDGLLDDARDYLWYNDYGPWGTQIGFKDPYVQSPASCRDQYIILLTDGAPNLDMRPACQGGACPYQDSWEIADSLFQNTGSKSKVQTFVIGFSVNGSNQTPNDGFPGAAGAITSCKQWYSDTSAIGGNNDPKTMDARCTALGAAVPKGSTASACCELNKIALYGSGGPTATTPLGAFFANSQADLVVAFSRILASVAKNATSRTTPAASPGVNVDGNQQAATFVASFIPNARKVWSGEIDRTRVLCSGAGGLIPTPQPQDVAQGDSFAVNTAVQAANEERYFFTVVGDQTGTRNGFATVDSYRTLRPYTAATPSDGIPAYRGDELAGINNSLLGTAPRFDGALNIDKNTCKRTQFFAPGGIVTQVPALNETDCTTVIWDFATSYSKTVSIPAAPGVDFNRRCIPGANTSLSATSGLCSISGVACQISNPTATCTIPGEACVPECSALGAVFRASPAVVGPPSGYLRDEGWRAFQSARAGRRPVLYSATTDGVLHAFKAIADTGRAGPQFKQELWAFMPPAVLPRLATNYPGGQQILLDGSPVVREVVWDRTNASASTPSLSQNDWHTTLVASLGSAGGGYYALNVTDGDCGGRANPNGCDAANVYEAPTKGAAGLPTVSIGGDTTNGSKKGPHFLWQLTDVEEDTGDISKKTRTGSPGDNKTFVPLFGKQTFTPAITTLNVLKSGVPHQIGVAILPGGIDGTPVPGQTCQRAVKGSYGSFGTSDASDTTELPARNNVRRWGTNCTTTPVPGRGLTIVRLDTGEIIRHFGRKTQDVPKRVQPYTTDSPFDSPVIGQPIVYPGSLGSTAQRVFVGDADGTLWRLDLTEQCDIASMNTCGWKVTLFADVVAKSAVQTGATESMPIAVPPIVSQSPAGSIVVNVATGDQENIVTSADVNYVMSIEEPRNVANSKAVVRWYQALPASERVTGPMAVFDRTLYFATYKPQLAADVCGASASAFLWGLDYYNPRTLAVPGSGGGMRWCTSANTAPNGTCSAAYIDKEDVTALMGGQAQLIPGVSVRATLACTSSGALTDEYGQGITGMTPSSFEIAFSWSAARSPGGLPGAQSQRYSRTTAPPRYNASLDAWAFVTD